MRTIIILLIALLAGCQSGATFPVTPASAAVSTFR